MVVVAKCAQQHALALIQQFTIGLNLNAVGQKRPKKRLKFSLKSLLQQKNLQIPDTRLHFRSLKIGEMDTMQVLLSRIRAIGLSKTGN